MRLPLLFLASLILVLAHALGGIPERAVITTPGEQQLFAGRLNFQVRERAAGDHLRLSLIRGNGGTTLDVHSGWAIYPESPARVWVFDGARKIWFVDFLPKGIGFASTDERPEIISMIPKEILRRLPARFRADQ